MSEMVAQVIGVTKNYDGFSLSNISFDVKKGTVMAVLGDSGSGKTRILDSMMNMINIDGGKIKIFGCDVDKVEKKVKKDMAVIWGDYCFDDGMTVTGMNLVFKNIYKNWSEETYFSNLENLSILPNTNIKYLPKGTNICIQMAAALSHDSKLIIIDEPTADMDEMYIPKLKKMVQEYIKDSDNCVLYFSRGNKDFDEVADYVTVLDKGKILISGKKERILERHGIIKYVKGKPCKIDASLIVGFEKSSTGAVILINNRNEFKKKYPSIPVGDATLEDILKYYTLDNTTKS